MIGGDKPPLTIGILLAEWLCASDVRRFRIRHRNESHPVYQSGAKPRHVKNLHLPSKLRTSPRAPAPHKANQIIATQRRVLVGEVLGERGRLGGREPHLSRGGSLPPRSSSFLPPRSSFLKNTNFSAKSLDESGFICYHKGNRKKLSGNSVTFRPFCRLYG